MRFPSGKGISHPSFASPSLRGQLATRLGLSKQAANDLVREFEAKGYITREPDPDDGRAPRIVATDRGWQAGETAQEASNAVGRRWTELVGEERYAVFEEVLHAIVAASRVPQRTAVREINLMIHRRRDVLSAQDEHLDRCDERHGMRRFRDRRAGLEPPAAHRTRAG